jgi:hypothetical protein
LWRDTDRREQQSCLRKGRPCAGLFVGVGRLLTAAAIGFFDAFSSREPVPTPHQVRGRLSLENAYASQQTVDGLQGTLEFSARSSYVPRLFFSLASDPGFRRSAP